MNNHDFAPICGKFIDLRESQIVDSSFILTLRTSPKARFLHKTTNDLNAQQNYMRNYKNKKDEFYFIAQNKHKMPLGTNSIYPTYNKLALNLGLYWELGRWIMSDESNFLEVLECDFLTKFAFFELFKMGEICAFTINPNNKSVINFHKKFGAIYLGRCEDDLEVFSFDLDAYLRQKMRIEILLKGE